MHIKIWGGSLVALGLGLACSKGNESVPPAPQTAGSSGSTAAPIEAAGGHDSTEVRRGERGSSCDSTSDCEDDLSCVVTHDCPVGVACSNKSCQPSDFEVVGTGKSCHVSDCKTTADCCGDMPQVAPTKCANRASICAKPTLTGCTAIRCATTADCGPGTCGGKCSLDAKPCLTTADCAVNTCDTAAEPDVCALSATDCSTFTCTVNTCSLPLCNCQNPEYDPTHPICTDPDCEGICGFACEDERCVVDDGCTSDSECAATTPFCSAGECTECRTREDCEDEECVAGRCGPRCEADTQCALFEACQAGECAFVGCRSDRECVLHAVTGKSAVSQDPRLAKCSVQAGLGACVFPCEIDAQCGPSEVCSEGTCKYIGCETDSECKTIAGLHNLPVPTPQRPWSTTAVCRPDAP
ncbi:MAG: hypothetical protein K0R38_3475 [Polyangiaceae bacterium]|jgi:hypothetical protein|nr:hypothetical protein [Polyangiaceae bacterium]